MKKSQIKHVRAMLAQIQLAHLIFDVTSVENDFVSRVRAVALPVPAAHRKISFLCREFFGVLPTCRINSNLCFPSLLCA
mgnify:CR=1 FL=1